ncbi:hypothetical protein CDAR_19161 [Caerostris darwini]|uniref:Uncharacterized protein n=1 Tax=Caerostris darwini TaxID=1538125 RepID=A0AAV4WBB2_9ARAC|nr:hypothetical protein CDAR_19161 [Caerostris darwini]
MPEIIIQDRWFFLHLELPDWMEENRKELLKNLVPRLILGGIMTHYAITIRERLNFRTYNCICLASFIQYGLIKPSYQSHWVLYTYFNTMLYAGALAVGSAASFIGCGRKFLVTRRLRDFFMSFLYFSSAQFFALYVDYIFRNPSSWFHLPDQE